MSKPTDKDTAGPAAAAGSLRRRAIHDGFYNGQRIREGQTFTLRRAKDHSDRWMRVEDASVRDDTVIRDRKAPAAQSVAPPKSRSTGDVAPADAGKAPSPDDAVI